MDELTALVSDQRRASYNVDICFNFQSLLMQKVYEYGLKTSAVAHEEKLSKKASGWMVDTIREIVWSKFPKMQGENGTVKRGNLIPDAQEVKSNVASVNLWCASKSIPRALYNYLS